jgi:hypothetical protein
MPSRSQTRRKQRGGTLTQGKEFSSLHMNQHGGAATMLSGAPVGYTGELEGGLRESARLSQYDDYFRQASGMSDTGPVQKGGSSRKKSKSKQKSKQKSKLSRKSKQKLSRKSKQKLSRKSKQKLSRKSKQSGGSRAELGYGNVGDSYMLLSPSTKTGSADFSNPLLKH